MPTPNLKPYRERMAEWDAAFRSYVSELCSHPLVVNAYLVGSRSRGIISPTATMI